MFVTYMFLYSKKVGTYISERKCTNYTEIWTKT